MKTSKIFIVNILLRGCFDCDIFHKSEYLVPAEDEKDALAQAKEYHDSLPLGTSNYHQEWKVKQLTKFTPNKNYRI